MTSRRSSLAIQSQAPYPPHIICKNKKFSEAPHLCKTSLEKSTRWPWETNISREASRSERKKKDTASSNNLTSQLIATTKSCNVQLATRSSPSSTTCSSMLRFMTQTTYHTSVRIAPASSCKRTTSFDTLKLKPAARTRRKWSRPKSSLAATRSEANDLQNE